MKLDKQKEADYQVSSPSHLEIREKPSTSTFIWNLHKRLKPPYATIQELFDKIDLEEDGLVYLKEIVVYLRAMNEEMDSNAESNLKVSIQPKFLIIYSLTVQHPKY